MMSYEVFAVAAGFHCVVGSDALVGSSSDPWFRVALNGWNVPWWCCHDM